MPLPNPLTLAQALAFADVAHPDLALAEAEVARARARTLEVDARTGARAYVDLTPQWGEASSGEFDSNDSRARAVLEKPLYDFGRQSAYRDAAAANLARAELQLLDARAQRRLIIMERFFAVLLADQYFSVTNEDMAQRYIALDRARERQRAGQLSDVDVAAIEERYRAALDIRTEAQQQQVSARARLAAALGRHRELPAELTPPALVLDRELPDYETAYTQALAASPAYQALSREVDTARSALAAERAGGRPVLTGEVEAAAYERQLSSRNDRRATLNLRIPLYQGGVVDAAVARGAAELATREARRRQAEQDLAQVVRDLLQQLEVSKVKRESAKQRLAYRDLYLDRSRALYELEARTDLGDALTRLTEAQWLAARADYEAALLWARLEALQGTLVPETRP